MPPRELKERTRLFALAVLRRAGNSVRSNYRAARNGRSHAEFTSKLGETYEEADECRDWLQYLIDSRIYEDRQLLQEAHELTKIFAASLQTARKKKNVNL